VTSPDMRPAEGGRDGEAVSRAGGAGGRGLGTTMGGRLAIVKRIEFPHDWQRDW